MLRTEKIRVRDAKETFLQNKKQDSFAVLVEQNVSPVTMTNVLLDQMTVSKVILSETEQVKTGEKLEHDFVPFAGLFLRGDEAIARDVKNDQKTLLSDSSTIANIPVPIIEAIARDVKIHQKAFEELPSDSSVVSNNPVPTMNANFKEQKLFWKPTNICLFPGRPPGATSSLTFLPDSNYGEDL